VSEQANDAVARSRSLRQLQDKYLTLLSNNKASGNAYRLLNELFSNPYMTAPRAAELLDVTVAGARGILNRLSALHIVQEITESWPRFYVARELLQVIDRPIPVRAKS
jgi:Fic family protein